MTGLGVGYVVKEKVGELEDTTREEIRTRMKIEVVGCFHNVLGKEKFLVQFEDGQKKDMSSSLLVCFKVKMVG